MDLAEMEKTLHVKCDEEKKYSIQKNQRVNPSSSDQVHTFSSGPPV